MRISVIIATFNRCGLLARTLPTVLNQQFPREQYEVIVVVDGSSDGTSVFLHGLKTDRNLRIIEQPNRGQAAAINKGLETAAGDLVLFLDDDILCGPTLLTEHATAERAGNACLAYGPVLLSPEHADPLAADWAHSFCNQFFETTVKNAPERGWYGCMASANSSAPRSVLLSVGGLDESYDRGNDREFGLRLLKAGFRFSWRPGAVVHQIFYKTRSDILKDASDEGIAEVHLCRKHPEYRAHSRVVTMWSEKWWKRLAVRVLVQLPVSLEPLLRPLTWSSARLRTTPQFRRLALGLFAAQQSIVAYRGANKEAGGWGSLRREFGKKLPVLMYHHIGPLRPGADPFLTISPGAFERHLRWLLHHGFTTIRTSDWVAYQRDGKPLPEKPVLLTFDDAFSDTAYYAFPLLQKYRCAGTVFVVTDEIGGANVWDRPLGVSVQPLMTAEEIRHWASQGVEIGAHTCTHRDLRTSSREQVIAELKGSRDHLRELLGTPVMSVAYPYGYLDDSVAEHTREYFDAAFTCDAGLNDLTTDLMHLKRATIVPRYTWLDVRLCVCFGFNPFLLGRIQLGLLRRRLFRM
jgi:glycosyltransferase involved in cell wall biosynthesis/peptidoglycan/xylan/chitin deacetylase (PgdA/CDA1 family)